MHDSDAAAQEGEQGYAGNLGPASSTQQASGWPRLHSQILFPKKLKLVAVVRYAVKSQHLGDRDKSLRPAWSTQLVPGQPRLYRETLKKKNSARAGVGDRLGADTWAGAVV